MFSWTTITGIKRVLLSCHTGSDFFENRRFEEKTKS
jgi:hypothetical protein